MYAQRGHNDDEAVVVAVAVTPHSHSLAHPLTHTHTPALTDTLSRTLIRVKAIDFQPSHSVVRQVNISGPTLQSARGVAPTLMCNKSSQRIKKRQKQAHCPPLSAATPTTKPGIQGRLLNKVTCLPIKTQQVLSHRLRLNIHISRSMMHIRVFTNLLQVPFASTSKQILYYYIFISGRGARSRLKRTHPTKLTSRVI